MRWIYIYISKKGFFFFNLHFSLVYIRVVTKWNLRSRSQSFSPIRSLRSLAPTAGFFYGSVKCLIRYL